MASIATSIEIYDKVSRPINSIIAAIGNMCDAFDSAERSMNGTFDTSTIEQTRRNIERAALEVIQLGNNTDDVKGKQNRYNNSVRQGSSAMDGLVGKVGRLVATYASIRTVGAAMSLSDEMTQTTSRLGMLVEGEEEVLALQEQIYQSAQRSRGSYQDTADAIAKMGMMAGVGDGVDDTFKSTGELIAFTEQLNKQFTIAGTSQEGISAAMLQLTQAMSSGVLRGEELNSVFEQAPTIIQSIADYLDVPIGSIRAMAAEGQITADIVKNAMLSAAEETNTKFSEMPMTWGQTWTMMKNQALMTFQPILQKINEIANSEGFQTFITGLLNGLSYVASFLLWIIDLVGAVAQFFSNNWSIIEPIVWGIVAALGAYYAIMAITNIITGINALITGVKAASDTLATGATFAATAEQHGYNAALLACPLTWIILLILAVVAAIMAFCSWIAKATGIASSGFGVICGGVMVVVAFFKNLALSVANIALGIGGALGAVANNMLAVFWNAICSIQSFFWGLLQTVMEVIEGVCKTLNKIPFVEIDYSGISSAADSYAAKKAEAENSKMEYKDVGAAFQEGFNTYDTFESGWVEKAYNSGAEWGDGVSAGVSDFFSGGSSTDNVFDPNNYGTDGYNGYDASHMPENVSETADNTGAMADSMEISGEDLKYLRDIAEREVINRFTTAEIKIDMTNNNTISSDMDLDGIVDYLVVGVNEAMATAAEGVHV